MISLNEKDKSMKAMTKELCSFSRAEDSYILSNGDNTNTASPKTSAAFDLKDLKKKFLHTDNFKKSVKEKCFVSIPSIQERKHEHDSSLIAKNISPRHSRSPNGSGSGQTLAKLAGSQYITTDSRKPASAYKRGMITSNNGRLSTSPKGTTLSTIPTIDYKIRPMDSLAVSTNAVNPKRKMTNSSLAYQKKIDSFLKKK